MKGCGVWLMKCAKCCASPPDPAMAILIIVIETMSRINAAMLSIVVFF